MQHLLISIDPSFYLVLLFHRTLLMNVIQVPMVIIFQKMSMRNNKNCHGIKKETLLQTENKKDPRTNRGLYYLIQLPNKIHNCPSFIFLHRNSLHFAGAIPNN